MNMRRLLAGLCGVAIGLGMASTRASAAAAPLRASLDAEPDQAKKPIYDEQADAKQQIAAALAKAKRENRRVLIQWGGNWCSWCIKLNNTLTTDKDLNRELMYEYDVVHIDAGRPAGKNIDLAHSYGSTPDKDGFPFLTILDADGKPVATTETGALEKKDANGESVLGEGMGHDTKKLMTFLKLHEAKPIVADAYLADALSKAKAEGKSVILRFGAPWCIWCHRLQDLLDTPAAAELLAKDYINIKVDIDRMTGGKDLLAKYRTGKDGGIPWFVILDGDGKALATSDAKGGNIGFPTEPADFAHLADILSKTAKKLSPDEQKRLIATLQEGAGKIAH